MNPSVALAIAVTVSAVGILISYSFLSRIGRTRDLAFAVLVWVLGIAFAVLSFLLPVSPDTAAWSTRPLRILFFIFAISYLTLSVPGLALYFVLGRRA